MRISKLGITISSTILLLTASLQTVYAQDDDCRFALRYKQQDLISDPVLREDFLTRVLKQEAKFARDLGFDRSSGLTLDGQ
jgi:hypothetical protein